jgi:hypothetical protein
MPWPGRLPTARLVGCPNLPLHPLAAPELKRLAQTPSTRTLRVRVAVSCVNCGMNEIALKTLSRCLQVWIARITESLNEANVSRRFLFCSNAQSLFQFLLP